MSNADFKDGSVGIRVTDQVAEHNFFRIIEMSFESWCQNGKNVTEPKVAKVFWESQQKNNWKAKDGE